MALPTLAAGLVELAIIFLLFRKQLLTKIEVTEDDFHIESKFDLWVGVVHLAICLVFLIVSSYINIEMWIVSLSCAGSLMIFNLVTRIVTKKNWIYITESLKRLPYQLIPFFLSMFIIVVALNTQGISEQIAGFLYHEPIVFVYGTASYLSANIINNIPMSILFANLMNGLTGVQYTQAVYSTIIGSNIGAFLTPLGALAGIMFSALLMKQEIKYSFASFIKYGIIISIPTIGVALLVLFFLV
jgi:arsenical pump membrane protein